MKSSFERKDNTSVNDVMRKDVFSIYPNEHTISAFKIMMKNNHDRLQVRKKGKNFGIISRFKHLMGNKNERSVRNESGTH